MVECWAWGYLGLQLLFDNDVVDQKTASPFQNKLYHHQTKNLKMIAVAWIIFGGALLVHILAANNQGHFWF